MGRIFVFALLVLTGLLFIVGGDWSGDVRRAQTDGNPDQPDSVTNGNGERLTVTAVGLERPADCELTIVVVGEGARRRLNLEVQAEPGIYLDSRGAIRYGDERITFDDRALGANGERTFTVNCRLDTARNWLPGAYGVQVTATDVNSLEQYARANAYIYVRVDDNGQPNVLRERRNYDRAYPDYEAGNQNIHYALALTNGDYPTSGNLHLRVIGQEVNVPIVIDIRAVEGMTFYADTAQYNDNALTAVLFTDPQEHVDGVELRLAPLWVGSERIVNVPFTLKEGCVPGHYPLEMITRVGNELVAEQVPYRVEIGGDPNGSGQAWFAGHSSHAVSAQPAVAPLGPELSLAVGNTGGGAPRQPLPPTATPRPLPSPYPTSPPLPPPAPGWYLHQNLNGSLWAVYRQYGEPAGIPWIDFKASVRTFNPNLGDNFYAGQTYWLPVP